MLDVIQSVCESRGVDETTAFEIAAEVCGRLRDYAVPPPMPGGGYYQAETPLACPINEYWQPVTKYKLGKSKKATTKRNDIAIAIKDQHPAGLSNLVGRVAVVIDTWPNNHHSAKVADVDAYAKCVLDSLEDVRILNDDRDVDHLLLRRHREAVKGGKHAIAVWEY